MSFRPKGPLLLGAVVCLLLSAWLLYIGSGSSTETLSARSVGGGARTSMPSAPVVAANERPDRVATPTGSPTEHGADSAKQITVHVYAEDKTPLDAATLTIVTADKSSLILGSTHTDGTCSVDEGALLPGAGRWLTAEKTGFAADTSLIPQPIPRDIHITLRREAQLTGRVVLDDGRAAGRDLRVLCWPRGTEPLTYLATRESLATRTSTRLALTDDAGLFVVNGLRPETHYSIAVGGRGLAALDLLCGVVSGTADISISVHQLHISALTFRDSHGSAVSLFGDGAIWPYFRSWGQGGARVSVSRVTVALADEKGALLQVLENPECYVQTWATNQYGLSLSGLRVECHMPGFPIITEAYGAMPLQDGISKHSFELGGHGTETGAIAIRYTRAGLPTEAGGVIDFLAPDCQMSLTASGGREWKARLPSLSSVGERVVSGVPPGDYRMVLRDTSTGFHHPEEGWANVNVVANGTTVIDVPIDRVGALRVDYECRFPVSWGESPSLMLGTIGPGIVKDGVHGVLAKGIARFKPGASVLGGVLAGDYQVYPYEVSSGGSAGRDIARPVRVEPGKIAEVWMPITWP